MPRDANFMVRTAKEVPILAFCISLRFLVHPSGELNGNLMGVQVGKFAVDA